MEIIYIIFVSFSFESIQFTNFRKTNTKEYNPLTQSQTIEKLFEFLWKGSDLKIFVKMKFIKA